MRFYTETFFCDKKKGPICRMEIEGQHYPASICISQSYAKFAVEPAITIHLTAVEDLIAFKNSVLGTFNKVMREKYREVPDA